MVICTTVRPSVGVGMVFLIHVVNTVMIQASGAFLGLVTMLPPIYAISVGLLSPCLSEEKGCWRGHHLTGVVLTV